MDGTRAGVTPGRSPDHSERDRRPSNTSLLGFTLKEGRVRIKGSLPVTESKKRPWALVGKGSRFKRSVELGSADRGRNRKRTCRRDGEVLGRRRTVSVLLRRVVTSRGVSPGPPLIFSTYYHRLCPSGTLPNPRSYSQPESTHVFQSTLTTTNGPKTGSPPQTRYEETGRYLSPWSLPRFRHRQGKAHFTTTIMRQNFILPP